MSRWKYAFSLSQEEVAVAEPPGTTRLIEPSDASPHDHIHLIPPPTTLPSDPLNWPGWRKHAVLALMSIYCGSANFGTASIAPALQILQYQFPPDSRGPPLAISSLTHLVAVNVLVIGLSNVFWVPLANTFGRRPVMIVALGICVLGSVWCGLATSLSSLLAARAIQGVGFGPADSIAANVVGEMFFVHERGRRMAIYTIFLSGGSFIGGLSGGAIAGTYGYRYIFWIDIALFGFCLLGQLLLVPETFFDREAQYQLEAHEATAAAAAAAAASSVGDETQHGPRDEKINNVETIEQRAISTSSTPSGRSIHGTFAFSQSLKTGIYRGHLGRNFLAPWLSLAFPGTWVVMLHYGGLLGGLVTISTVGPQFLAMPPYLWSSDNLGLINLGGLIGCVLGGLASYLVVDRILTTRGALRSSHGLAEPERRLPVMFPALFLATTGIWTFGFCAANPSPHAWAGLVVGLGMVGFGIAQIPSVGFNYIIDAYTPIAENCFVITAIVRAVVSFAWTFFVSDWVSRAGPALPFGIFGMIMAIFSLLTLPLWLYGKRMRIATAGLLVPRE